MFLVLGGHSAVQIYGRLVNLLDKEDSSQMILREQ